MWMIRLELPPCPILVRVGFEFSGLGFTILSKGQQTWSSASDERFVGQKKDSFMYSSTISDLGSGKLSSKALTDLHLFSDTQRDASPDGRLQESNSCSASGNVSISNSGREILTKQIRIMYHIDWDKLKLRILNSLSLMVQKDLAIHLFTFSCNNWTSQFISNIHVARWDDNVWLCNQHFVVR